MELFKLSDYNFLIWKMSRIKCGLHDVERVKWNKAGNSPNTVAETYSFSINGNLRREEKEKTGGI